MNENLRNAGTQGIEMSTDANQALIEVISLIAHVVEDSPWNYHNSREMIESRLGRAIQTIVQAHLRRDSIVLPQGRVNVGRDVNLDFGNLELYRTSNRYDRTVGGRGWPLGSDAWLRNFQGILDQVTRLG